MSKTKQEIYRIIDSFLAEAKDQNGKERSLEQLNQDRHLAAERFEDLINQLDCLLVIQTFKLLFTHRPSSADDTA